MSIAEKLTAVAENEQRVAQILSDCNQHLSGRLDDEAKTLTELPDKIVAMYDCGAENGYADGYTTGYSEGYSSGIQAEYDKFWDAYQNNGTLTNYYQLFMQSGWDDTTFNPKYPITCSGTQSYHVTNASQIFYNCYITEINIPITVTGLPMTQTFYNCTKLEKIADLTLNGVTGFSQCFSYCSALEDINVHGSIDVNFSLAAATALSRDSIVNVFEALSNDADGQTATFNKKAVDKAFETSEGANDGSTNPDSEWVALTDWKTNWTYALL